MSSESNPFKAPEARVEDVIANSGEFIPDGQQVPAGNGIGWIGKGWDMFREAPGTWIGLSLTFLLITIVIGMIPLVNFFFNLILPVFIGGLMMGCKAQEEGEELRVGHLFAAFSSHAGKLILVGLVYLVGIIALIIVMAVVGGGIGFGAAMMGSGKPPILAMLLIGLLAFALMVPLAMAVWYAPALVVFHEVPPVQAMKSSFFACLKNFLPFLVYGLVTMVLAILACLPIFLGWLVLFPVLQASIYASYKDMFTRS
ncbi:MAG TPA: BPSS1780 family membrane protein [Rhodocyclaceae bacterium]|nr:BPSS1780 family membrane protein [Rhodocyclaceae bacterium]